MKKLMPILLLCFMISALLGNEEIAERANILEQQNKFPLFVSLGGTCITAGMFRHFGLRDAAFPFDWMYTIDDVKLIELLDNNFTDFINPDFFIMHPLQYGHL